VHVQAEFQKIPETIDMSKADTRHLRPHLRGLNVSTQTRSEMEDGTRQRCLIFLADSNKSSGAMLER
jgi:hypothetical protein